MERVLLLDPSIGSNNLGDEIIMECIRKELEFVTHDKYVLSLPTHVSSFHWYQVLRNSSALQIYANCRYKFVGGSNLLVKKMLTHYPQWNINLFNCAPLKGCVLVGVGASSHNSTDWYTRYLYRIFLNKNYVHSVRDERTRQYVEEELGLKAINTGCATMWMLTPDFCKSIPKKKSDEVVLTLTACTPIDNLDQILINILKDNYKNIYFWPQGLKDAEYFGKLKNTEGIEVLPATKDAYDSLLTQHNIDYVGTRLHGGIYAMRHRRRAIIIAIDERAREINKCNNLNCIEKSEIPDRLEQMIKSDFATEIQMPFDEINHWRSQFL